MAQVYNSLGKLVGVSELPIDSTLRFSHSAIEDDLWIRSGANSINWSYNLNTQSTPTVGGEVVQILSCFVGPITISGLTAGFITTPHDAKLMPSGWADNAFTPADEVSMIINWFTRYMHLSGGGRKRRVEEAIKFTYAARDWEFYIQVTDLQGFELERKQVAIPWSITAEIVDDPGLDYFVQETMSQYTDSLTSRASLQVAISKEFGFFTNPYINPALNAQVSSSDLAVRMGDNFQALVSAWAYGDFNTFGSGFSTLADPKAQTGVDNPYDYYSTLVGGTYLGNPDKIKSDYNAAFGGATGSSTTTGELSAKEAWIGDVLNKMGFNTSSENVCFMKSWQAWEGGHTNGATYNWMNSTQKFPGSKGNNPGMRADIQAYKTYEDGIQATVNTINNGNYPDIIEALRSGNPLQNWPSDGLQTWVAGPNGHGASSLAYSNRIKASTQACVKKSLENPAPTGTGLWKVSNTAPGDPFWGGSKEIANRFLAIAVSKGAAAGGTKDRGVGPTLNGNWSDHDLGMTVGYAIDIHGSESALDAAADAMAAATGKAWNFKAKSYSGDWFDTTVNGYRLQIGWRQSNHAPGDNMHIHLGVRDTKRNIPT